MRWRVIAKKEIGENIQKKSFIALTLFLPVLIIGFPLIVVNLGQSITAIKVGVVDSSDGSFITGLTNYSSAMPLNIYNYSNIGNLTEAIVAGDVSGGLVIPVSPETENITVYTHPSNVMSYSLPSVLKSYRDGLSHERVEQLLTSQNVSNASAYLAPFAYVTKDVSGEAGGDQPSFFVQMIPMLLFLSLIFSGQFMAESLAGERERKTIELLLSAPVSKRDIMVGKVIGVAALVIIQVVIWFGAIFAISGYTGQNLVNPAGLAQALVYFSVAVLMFCTLGVIISSFTKTIRDAQQYFGIAVVPLYMFAIIPLDILPEALVNVLTYTPIISVAIATRQALSGKLSVLSLEGITILLISFITLAVLVMIGSKIFEKKVVGGL